MSQRGFAHARDIVNQQMPPADQAGDGQPQLWLFADDNFGRSGLDGG